MIDIYPPVSTSTATSATVNCIRQICSFTNSASTTANTATTTANPALTIANNALTTSTLATAVNVGTTAGGAVSVGVSGQTLNLQNIPNPKAFQLAFSDEVTAITTSNMINLRSPFTFNIRSSSLPLFMLLNLGTSGTTTFDIMKNGNTIYNTKPSITYTASPTNAQYTSAGSAGTLLTNPTVIFQYDLVIVYVFSIGVGHLGAKCIISAS